jgi:C-terminal processing protease CtpA/Prc
MLNRMLLCCLFSAVLAGAPALAAEKGKIGLSLDIAADGFFSPTLVSVKVKTLVAGGAAEKAGLLVGDQILKIADCAIPGCPADDAKALMKKNKGESVSFFIKQADGAELIKTVVAE